MIKDEVKQVIELLDQARSEIDNGNTSEAGQSIDDALTLLQGPDLDEVDVRARREAERNSEESSEEIQRHK